MNAVPERFPPESIDNYHSYACPVSGIPAYGSNAPRKWVHCPLVGNNFISYGICLDLQGLARTENFQSDSFVTLFEDLSAKENISVDQLRRLCLSHQVEVLSRMTEDSSEDIEKVINLKNWVESLLGTF